MVCPVICAKRQVRGEAVFRVRYDGDGAATMFGAVELRLDDVHGGGCAWHSELGRRFHR